MPDVTADLRKLVARFHSDLEFIIARLGVRGAARALKTSTSAVRLWCAPDANPRSDTMEKVFVVAEKLRSE